jgi:hypothetical protein
MIGRGGVVLGVLMVLVGIAIVVRTLSAGGGAIAYGTIVGLLFVATGAGRVWLARGRA